MLNPDSTIGETDPQLLTTDPTLGATQPPSDTTADTGETDPQQDATKAAVQGSLFVASKRPKPQQWAAAMKVAQKLGLQPDLVARNLDGLQQKVDNGQPDLDRIVKNTPGLAQWLQHPDNATLGRHELEPLGRVDQHTRTVSGAADAASDFLGGSTATGMADLGSSAGLLAMAFGHTSPEQAAKFVADMNTRAKFLRAQAPDYTREFSQAMAEHAGDVDKAWNATLDKQSVFLRNDIIGALARYVDPTMHAENDVHTLGDVLSMIGAAIKRPRGLAYAGLEGLPGMAPMMGGAAAGGVTGGAIGSVIPGIGTAVGGTVGAMIGSFGGMAPVNVGSEINAELTKRGVDVTDEHALLKAFSDPKLMAQIRSKAEAAGVTNAAVASLFSGFAGKLAEGTEGTIAKGAAHAADMGVQAAGMGAAQAAGEAAKGEKPSVGNAVLTAIQTLGASAGMEAIGASRRAALHPDPVTAAAEATTQAGDALRAHRDAAALDELGKAVKDAPTTASIPEKIKELVETATGNDPNAQVYFQSDEWNKYWSDRGASPAKAAADLIGDGGKAYYEAQSTGAPVAIPLSDYVAHLAPTDHWDELLDMARTKPDGMSLGEAKDYLESLPATMRDIADDAVAERDKAPIVSDNAAKVGDAVREQLQSAGLTESAAKAQAVLYESTFRALGQRTGIDPLELYNRYGLAVQRGKAERQITAARQAATDAEANLTDEARRATDEEDPTLAQAAPELARPRSANGRLKNLTKASLDELANEYALNVDANANEARGATVLESDVPGEVYVGMKEGAMRAAGRVAQRQKTIAKLEAEMARRGVDASEMYMRGSQNARNLDPTDFAFGDNAFNQSAFHGSPHVFDEFSLHKIGAGEGVQAYGWGLYFAGKKEIAEYYRDKLSGGKWSTAFGVRDHAHVLNDVYDAVRENAPRVSPDATRMVAREFLDAVQETGSVEEALATYDAPDGLGEQWFAAADKARELDLQPHKGRLYHVDIPDDDTMLDWDKPLDQQPEKVQQAIEKLDLVDEDGASYSYHQGHNDNPTGQDLYDAMISHLSEGGPDAVTNHPAADVAQTPQEAASRILAAEGVTGIKYEDSASRYTNRTKTHNYVIFDDKLVKIKSFEQPAYHGSPHLFDKFSLHAMGSGEGAQAYGWGLYFASNKEIAKYYRDSLVPPAEFTHFRLGNRDLFRNGQYRDYSPRGNSLKENIWSTLAEHLLINEGDLISAHGAGKAREYILHELDDQIERYKEEWPEGVKPAEELRADLAKPGAIDIGVTSPTGRLYKVDIPEDDTYIQYEEPISAQPKAVQDAVRDLLKKEGYLKPKDNGPRQLTSAFKAYVMEKGGFSEGATGAAAYSAIAKDLGSEEAASRFLAEKGVSGVKYLDNSSRGNDGGKKSFNYVVFDENLIKILDYEQKRGEGQPRGRITFGSQGTLIELLERADRSTFLHETGHFYLNILHDLAHDPSAPAELTADYATVRQWLGAEGDAPLTRDQHEQFARGFEAYLMEGKAPSQALRGVFYRFKTWLTGIYRQAKTLNVTLSPEIRSVFDRLVATQEEIRQSDAEQQTAPLFDDPKAAGLTDKQAESYAAAVADAHQTAEEELTQKAMADIRRQESKEWAALRKPIEEQATKEVDADPVQRAMALLKNGTEPDGSPLTDMPSVKLSRADVETVIGKDGAKLLPRSVYAENGVHPDVVADMLGFDSSSDMLSQLTQSLPRKRAIAEITDQRMRLEHGERMTDAEVHEAATQAVRGTKRAEVLRRELEILASDHLAQLKGLVRAVSRKIPPTEVVRQQAREIIGDKQVKDLRPDLLAKAAAKSAKEAREALLKGDVQGAFQAKQKELLATEVYQASIDARDAVDGALQEFKQIFRSDEKLSKTRDIDLVNAARAVLAAFGIGQSDKTPDAYLEQMRKYDPDLYDTVKANVDAATQNASDYKSLRFDDFHDMHELVRSLWEMSRRTRQFELEGKKIDRQEVVQALAAHLEELAPKGPTPGSERAVTKGEKRLAGFTSMWAALRRVEHWVRAMDKGQDAGDFRRYLWNPINDAAVKYRVEKNARMQEYKAIVEQLGPTMTHDKINAPELGYTFDGKRELLGALLHTGNESNLRKLLVGRGWGSLSDSGVLDDSKWRAFLGRMHTAGTLTKNDYDFVQAVWNLFESTKPDAQRAHRDMYGHYFEEITARPFATPFGRYEGGYYPAKADPFLTPEQGRKESATAVLESDNSSMFPSTGRGFTKSRVEYNRPLILDANAIPTHLDAVLRFTHINPHIVDVARVLRDRGFAEPMDAADKNAISELLDPWLRRTAQQAIDTPAKSKAGRTVDDMARRLRTNAGMQILSASLATAAEQLTHVPAVALRVSPAALARGLWEFARAPKQTAEDIHARSDYMATRESAGLMEVRKAVDHIMLDPNVAQKAGAWLNEHAAFLTRAIQHVEDHVTWGGAYDEALRSGMEEKEAIRHADAVVRETLGAFEPESISRFEASAPLVKLFSMFYSFFNTKANFMKTEVTTVLKNETGLMPRAAKLAAVYTFGFLLPAVMATAIKQQLNGEKFDKDDDGPWDDVFRLFFGSQLEQAGRMVPVVGPLTQFTVEHMMHGKPADLVSSPALGTLQQAAKVPGDALQALHDKDIKKGEITDLFTLIGLATGTPARPIAKPLGYLNDIQHGKTAPTGPVDFTRGLLTGR